MAGQTLRILEKNTFSYTAAQLPLGQVALIPVMLNVSTKDAVFATLALRAHSLNAGAGGAGTNPGVRLFAYNCAPTDEDPNTLYRSGTAAMTGTKLSTATTATGLVTLDALATPGNLAGYVDIILEVSQWGTTAATVTAVVSADLILKFA